MTRIKPNWQTDDQHASLFVGDARVVLRQLPAGRVQTCVTSPPYWGLRDYGVDGQLGLEPTPEEYVANMVEVFREVRRVLRKDGTCWLNLGDSYARAGGWSNNAGLDGLPRDESSRPMSNIPIDGSKSQKLTQGLKEKDLVGIPWRVAFALQADGWYLRSDIIWHKPNPMPSSVTDRPTTAHEYIFLLSKRGRYFYDAEAVKEPASDVSIARIKRGVSESHKNINGAPGQTPHSMNQPRAHDGSREADLFRNKRSVWTIPTAPFSAAHFATYPPKLIEPCILAGTSQKGCCPKCYAPWKRIVDKQQVKRERPNDKTARHEEGNGVNACGNTVAGIETRTIGWEPTCDCGETETVPCVVLDPFSGAGTTGLVAHKAGRDYWGVELSREYHESIAAPRLDRELNRFPLFTGTSHNH